MVLTRAQFRKRKADDEAAGLPPPKLTKLEELEKKKKEKKEKKADCGICYSNKSSSEFFSWAFKQHRTPIPLPCIPHIAYRHNRNPENHPLPICKECIITYLEMRFDQVGPRSMGNPRCPASDCEMEWDYTAIKSLLPEPKSKHYHEATWEIWKEDRKNGLVECPKCKVCGKLEPETTPGWPRVVCSERKCAFNFCANCLMPWHEGAACSAERRQRVKKPAANRGEEETRLEALDVHWCPNCRAAFSKEAGCNKMTCSNCLHKFDMKDALHVAPSSDDEEDESPQVRGVEYGPGEWVGGTFVAEPCELGL